MGHQRWSPLASRPRFALTPEPHAGLSSLSGFAEWLSFGPAPSNLGMPSSLAPQRTSIFDTPGSRALHRPTASFSDESSLAIERYR